VDQDLSSVVSLKCADHKGSAMVIAFPLLASFAQNEKRLMFHRYSNTYFLAQIWGPGAYGREFPTTDREHELAAEGFDNIAVQERR